MSRLESNLKKKTLIVLYSVAQYILRDILDQIYKIYTRLRFDL